MLSEDTGPGRIPGAPDGWHTRTPERSDVGQLADLVASHQASVLGSASVDAEAVEVEAVGMGSWTRRQLVAVDAAGRIRAWARVHDRAAGRTVVTVTVDPVCSEGGLAGWLFRWGELVALEVAAQRQLTFTQLDSGAYAVDERQRRWLGDAGYDLARTWLQMSRPVGPEEADPGVLPPLRPGLAIRPVASHDNGLPVAADLQTVHQLLEESFADHFNSYRESFPEFLQRLREDPGHRWDHWWIATAEIDGTHQPAGAVVSSVLPADADGRHGSYIDYIGVHRRARGRGVAKALLHTVIADAARRGRSRVGLEVDADSPTGADGLYVAMGWQTRYRTESWHQTVHTA
ncbi:MAG TPA: GNAT family N-acetyltransferase [Propionibacteriaceae bacterium]